MRNLIHSRRAAMLSVALIATVAERANAQDADAAASAVAVETPAAAPSGAGPDTGAADSRAAGPDLSVPVFGIGTQVAMLMPAPTFGAGALAVCYDVGLLHVDVLGGLFLADDFQSSVRGNVRVFFPVHRGPIADFSLGVGGGFGYLEHVDGELEAIGEILAGAKIRSFVGRNIALEAILGVNVLFVGDFQSVAAGGRLMGTAGFVYFFR